LFLLSEYMLIFNLCVYTRILRVNNFTYTVLNADFPLIYIGVSVHIHVKFVTRHSVKRAN